MPLLEDLFYGQRDLGSITAWQASARTIAAAPGEP